MKRYDITFIGHMCFDEIHPYKGEISIAPGSAVLCGAMAATRIGKKVAVVVKMAEKDEYILESMKKEGIDVFLVPSDETTYSQVIHPSIDLDERKLVLLKSAGYFNIDEFPDITTKALHLAGISDQEFNIQYIKSLKDNGYLISADMQSFVRQVDMISKEICFNDVKDKKMIVGMMDKIKLDVVEANILTGLDNIEEASKMIETWGCSEIVITQSDGVLARVNGKTYYEKFTNQSTIGRTGRGDTTFAAYLAWREEHSPAEALKFAAALVSIKMESMGPFNGTINDVLNRIEK